MKHELDMHKKPECFKTNVQAGTCLAGTSQVIVSGDRIMAGEYVFEFLLTADHVSLILGLGDSTLRELEDDEELIPIRVRRQRRYPPQVLRDYIERCHARAREGVLLKQERRRLKEKEAELRDPGR